mmetsp:Transcript_35888/g.34944  ORF Transcript_35888/g.34944 Transcript_35888/m.34944 type:complete len:140 (-) Transcript_35888:246-665(-)
MFLVDLAGSERLSMLGDLDKVTQQETIGINKSLMILRKVIVELAKGRDKMAGMGDVENRFNHIPYRESKLTSILKQSLGGNAYCLMIACLSPSDYYCEENLSTLKYAMKTNKIRNRLEKSNKPKEKVKQPQYDTQDYQE